MSKLPEQKQKLYKTIAICQRVKETIDSKGWQEILGPKLDKMIASVVGQKDQYGVYKMGHLDRDREKAEYYVGYKAALMDFNNEVYNHLIALEKAKLNIETLAKEETKDTAVKLPMEDTKYV